MAIEEDDDATRILPQGPPADDDPGDATVIRPRPARPAAASPAATAAGPVPTAAPPAPPPPAEHEGGNMLPVGYSLGEFEVTKVLGEGGFGIVYLAHDHSLGRRVALKEYMPSSLAQRIGRTQVSVKSERHRETFEAGRKSFVNEARLLAQFDHPSLVKVYRFWEANGTAYMVMPFYEGTTLKDELKAMAEPPDEAWLLDLLEPLSEALAVIHAEQCFHRDIAPDNVILLKGSERPLLLDFGAARRVIGDMTQALTVILKPGYAPVEQYAEVPGMKQGPWTDVYALAAVVYFAIAGKTPPTSVGRLMNDNYKPLAEIGAGRYSPGFLAAIDRALIVKPDDRTPSIDVFRRDLGLPPVEIDAAKTVRRTRPAPLDSMRAPLAQAVPVPARRTPLLIGGAVVVLAAAGGLYAWLGSRSTTTVSTPPAPETKASSVATPPTSSSAPAATPSAPVVVTAPTPAPPPVAAPFDPAREFERVVAGQLPGFHVEAAADKAQFRINKDKITFKVKSAQDGHLYVLYSGTDGSILQLFPNRAAKNTAIRADGTLSLPPPKSAWDLSVGGPPGTDHFLAIVSKHRRDFSALGLKERDGFLQTKLAAAAAAARAHGGTGSVFTGKPVCDEPCSDEYGAAVFTAEEIN